MNPKRVRVFRAAKGSWCFAYEKREDERWRVVETRGRGESWTRDEAEHRARVSAALVGARMRVGA